MAINVVVPEVGESIQEAIIQSWLKSDGSYVELDEVLLELETDKATVEVVATASGVLRITVAEGETINIGDTIGEIDETAAKPAAAAQKSESKPAPEQVAAEPVQQMQPDNNANATTLSPAAKRVVSENNLSSANISATGKGGRITKEDALKSLTSTTNTASTQTTVSSQLSAPRGESREKMSMMRQRIAERLVEVQQTAALLTTFNEIDMSSFITLRNKYKDSFLEKHGIKLGFMSIFVKAVTNALQQFPKINAYIEDSHVVYHNYCDIGIAVSTDKGLVVPVIRDAENLSFSQIEKAIATYAKSARERKIKIDDMTGGTFTITNGGVFGSLMSTPIINPPQSAILGMHKTQLRPVVVNGEIVIRPMMYVALSYDHRIVDGKESVQFLVKVKEAIESPESLLLGL